MGADLSESSTPFPAKVLPSYLKVPLPVMLHHLPTRNTRSCFRGWARCHWALPMQCPYYVPFTTEHLFSDTREIGTPVTDGVVLEPEADHTPSEAPPQWVSAQAGLLTSRVLVSLFLTRVLFFKEHEIFSLKYSAKVESRIRLFFIHMWMSVLKLIGVSIWY